MTLGDALAEPPAMSPRATAPATTSVLNLISPLRVEAVADAAHGVDQARLPARLELLADPGDVHLEGVRAGTAVARPHRLGELRIRDKSAPIAHQRGQDAELESGQI